MSNILDYIDWRGDIPFSASPFNQIDNLILSELAYLNLDGIVSKLDESDEKLSLSDAWKDYTYIGYDQSNLTYNPAPLLEKTANSKRFGQVMLGAYTNMFDTDRHIQFAAVSFFIDEKKVYIAFRGTDNTIEGWREDFNISYMSEVPGQAEAVTYVNKIAEKSDYDIFIGGHSKGGNLAIYAGAFCDNQYKDRIKKIYSNDGPGFNKEITGTSEYKDVLDKVNMIIPESSIVGVIMSNKSDKIIVKSDASGTMQHNPYSWEVLGDKFVLADKQSTTSLIMDGALNNWLNSLDETELKDFVNALFDILDASGASTLSEMSDNKWESFNLIMKAAKNMNPELRKNLMMVIKRLYESGRDVIWNEAMKGFDKGSDETVEKYKCPCCGYYTFKERAGGTYDICPVCYWEDDLIQLNDETYEGGANKVSLKQARINFLKFGACEERLIKYVRSPREDELTGIDI
ncbi:MAG: DUF2974 domain-containing protein [Lachnospiraceae bacterium]|nr:DUF2974 domain-containing protein [Lachnospiraceae bacterium]